MISRNFTPEQTLLDRLLADDAVAFEELTRRYCYPLYRYCMGKLNSKEDAKRVARNIFIALWEDRHALPPDFSLSAHLYKEVRKGVIQCLNNKLTNNAENSALADRIIPGFSTEYLQKAALPVTTGIYRRAPDHTTNELTKRKYEESWWGRYTPSLSIKGLKHALQNMVNF